MAKIARKLPERAAKKKKAGVSFKHEGREYSLSIDHGIYRLQSRRRNEKLNYSTGLKGAAAAIEKAKKFLRGEITKPEPVKPSTSTLADLLRVYKLIPRKAGARATKLNAARLNAIVRLVTGKKLAETPITAAGPKLWLEYARIRQGGTLDLSKSGRKPVNSAINSAIRCAVSIFTDSLRPAYAEHGITFAADVGSFQWLPEIANKKAPVESAMLPAWRHLYNTDRDLWRCIGLARCAGLRCDEIANVRRSWLVEKKGVVWIEVCDRPSEGYTHKTGEPYRAMIISKRLAKDLLSVKSGLLVGADMPHKTPGKRVRSTATEARYSREQWFERVPQEWLKQFTTARMPLHRMRGLYADNLKARTEEAMLARQAGITAAQKSLGHTSERTTRKSYLSDG